MTPILIVLSLILAGLALIVIEVLVIPGVGLIGALGVIALGIAGYFAFTTLSSGLAMGTVAAGVVSASLLFWLLPKTRTARSMVLQQELKGHGGDSGLADLLGRSGQTVTDLKPSGVARIDENLVDVISDGEPIGKGAKVAVIDVKGNRVVVQESTEPNRSEES